jgi:hypothetical protein
VAKRFADLKAVLERILATISEETDLLKEDQLARGTLVSIRDATCNRYPTENSKWWSISSSDLFSSTPTTELPEYWGRIQGIDNFISHTETYPWMPVHISEEELPF